MTIPATAIDRRVATRKSVDSVHPRAIEPAPEGGEFELLVRDATQRVRRTLAEALAIVRADPSRPQHVARHLGLDKNLAWKTARIVTDEDLLAAIPRLPGKAGIRILLDALLNAGAPAPVVDALRAALEEFDTLVETHAGDRETLQMMLTSLSQDAQRQRDETHRRLSYQGNSGTWGVQARAQISAHFVAPTPASFDPSGTRLDTAIISGLVDFRRLRPDVPWAVAALRTFRDDWSPPTGPSVSPIEPVEGETWTGQAPAIMRSFCSDPLPNLRLTPPRNNAVRYELVEGPVGNTAACTIMTGWYRRGGVDRFRSQHDWFGEHLAALSTPVETLLFDLYVHRELAFAIPPRYSIYSQLPGGPVYPDDSRDRGRLPLAEDLIDLGSPPEPPTPETPRYNDMIALAAERLGWKLADFTGFRLRLRYPPIPALAVFRYELPEPR